MKKRRINRREALAGFGALAAAGHLTAQDSLHPGPKLRGEVAGRITPRAELVNVLEVGDVAERKLASTVFSGISGSDRSYFDRITFRPRMMVPTTDLDLTVDVFGEKLFTPIVVAPMARQQAYHPEGELATARGAAAAKAVMMVSSESSFPIDKIAAAAKSPLWYQVYAEGEMEPARAHIQDAVKAGCKVLCITVGGLAHMKVNPALNWSVIDQLRQGVGIPVIIKGIMAPEEADAAVKKGIQGIIVSNYGGLLARGMAPAMEMLPTIVDAVGGRVPVLIDGGFRRGSDVVKALALGASAVLVGRPAMWGLAAYGADGVQSVVEMLQTETGRSMCQCGKPNLRSIDRTAVKIHET